MEKNHMEAAVKGMIVGGTMLVPGVSGGTMAMLLGIYDRLIAAVSSFRRRKAENFFFLLLFAAGGGLGMILIARPLLALLERYPMPMHYFFMGTVAGGVPLMMRQAKITRVSFRTLLYVGVGILAVTVLLPGNLFAAFPDGQEAGTATLAMAGILLAAALILPGISVSYILLMFGLYDSTMQAVGSLDLLFLLPLGAGGIAGILLLTKGLAYLMECYPQPTYLIIMGFVISSLVEIFPGVPDPGKLPVCLLMLAAGFFAIRRVSKGEEKKKIL